MNDELNQKAILYHKKYAGKIGTELRAPISGKEDLSLAYSPGVGAATLAISENPNLADELTLKGRTVAIVTDGSAILGLGNLGALPAIPVMEGKAALLKHFAGVDAFPICLTTSDPEDIIETVLKISPVFGAINLEDISAPRCFYIEEELRRRSTIPVMHDDQWGTATVVLAGLINALKLSGKKIEDINIVVSGIGAAGVAVSRLLFTAGARYIRFVDSHGLITKDRADLTKEKIELLNKSQSDDLKGGLTEALVLADVFIGLSKPGVLTEPMVKSMKEKPIIFALANPVPEIMPDIAKSAGAYVVATGRSDFSNQVNNALVFPGLLKAALEVKGCQFTNEVFLSVAHDLADVVKDLNPDSIIPSPFDTEVVNAVYNAGKKEFLKQLAK
jgi:malate dehydrogenase (oxaloacetate-decarboxylating)